MVEYKHASPMELSDVQPKASIGSSDNALDKTPKRGTRTRGKTGAKHVAHYSDQHEEYIPVSRSELRKLATFGWLQEGTGASGMFFASGAFWLLATLIAEHRNELDTYIPWFMLCAVSILFGLILIWIAYRHFDLKQKSIKDLFDNALADEREKP